jgi:uncharacterized membrane protein
MSERVDSVDILRGIAVLQMVFFQTFDFFAKADIYSDSPYYVQSMNMPVNGIGVGLFAFISGVSVYLSVSRSLSSGSGRLRILLRALRRYGGYILISLFFTYLMFGFGVFYSWGEALQGIGLSALVAALLLLSLQNIYVIAAFGILISLLQPYARTLLGQNTAAFPFCVFVLNALLLGFFSLATLLPITLFGLLLGFQIIGSGRGAAMKKSFCIGVVLISMTLLAHASGFRVDYYGRSPSFMLFFVGISYLLFSLVEFLIGFYRGRAYGVLMVFGRKALFCYLFHFVFILKPLVYLGIEGTFGTLHSILLATLSVLVIYLIAARL